MPCWPLTTCHCDLFLGDFLLSVAGSSFPYSFLLASLSGRNVEPSRDIPANRPREREYVRISALMVTSVAAAASRPFGPAAAAASAPSFTLLLRIPSAPRGFITRSTKSVACPPSCSPKLPPSRAIIDGAPHAPWKFCPPRHVITPRP